jgi:hypothetical protein
MSGVDEEESSEACDNQKYTDMQGVKFYDEQMFQSGLDK